jgi:hypothetical protein
MHASGGASESAAFDEVVAPLEAAAGKPLNGPGREVCLAAFRRAPDRFADAAADAAMRARANPLGLLIKMVESGDLDRPLPARRGEGGGDGGKYAAYNAHS